MAGEKGVVEVDGMASKMAKMMVMIVDVKFISMQGPKHIKE